MSAPLLPKLSLDSDVVFRRLFDEAPLLVSLLNALLHVPDEHRLTDLTILPPQVAGPLASDKESVVDLRAQTRSGRQFHIELQVRPFLSYAERALYYWAGMYHSQLQTGRGYDDLQPVLSIHILHFSLLPSDEQTPHFHHVYELRERRTGHRLSDHLGIHTIEMGKFHRHLPELATTEDRWLYFLKNGHRMSAKDIDDLAVPEIRSAEEKLRVISQDRLLRVQYEMRQKAERDAVAWEKDHIAAWLREGKRQGLDEGKRQGLDEGKRQGKQEAILSVLAARDLAVSSTLRARILACDDLAVLDRLLARVVTIAAADELLSDL